MHTETNAAGHFKTEIDIMSEQAEASASELRAQGWQGGGADYGLGAFPGDLEAVEARLGRKLDLSEALRFEAAIRTHLDE